MDTARTVLLVSLSVVAVPPASVQASDFWDEVRSPGIRRWRSHMREAEQAVQRQRWPAALRASEAALAEQSDRAETHALRGRVLGELGQDSEAVEALGEAYRLDASVFEALEVGSAAASIATRGNRYTLAAQIYERLLANMKPNSHRPRLFARYADVLLALGPEHLDDSIAAYREALVGRRRGILGPTLGLALALRRHHQVRESQLLLAELQAEDRRAERAIANLPLPEGERDARRALLYESQGRNAEAADAWRRAQRSGPWRRQSETGASRGGAGE